MLNSHSVLTKIFLTSALPGECRLFCNYQHNGNTVEKDVDLFLCELFFKVISGVLTVTDNPEGILMDFCELSL